jgi:hypothetical protein
MEGGVVNGLTRQEGTGAGIIRRSRRAFLRILAGECRRTEACRASSGLPYSLLVWC